MPRLLPSLPDRPCQLCGVPFQPYRSNQVFCSVLCRTNHYRLTHIVTVIPLGTTPNTVEADPVDLPDSQPKTN